MKHTLRQIFRSNKFVIGFVIFMAIVLTVIFYPIIVKDPPLEIISRGTFLPPGIYVNLYDSMGSATRYTLILDGAAERRISTKLGDEEREAMQKWLVGKGISEEEIDIENTTSLIELWENN